MLLRLCFACRALSSRRAALPHRDARAVGAELSIRTHKYLEKDNDDAALFDVVILLRSLFALICVKIAHYRQCIFI